MVGEGVLLECLQNPAVARILMINRRPYPLQHPRLQELLVPDFLHIESVASQLSGFDACFFCAGVTSVGKSEADYTRITYDTTLHFASTLAALNPQMTFIYVSGAGTDSTEQGRTMWARVKGRTENALTRLPFRQAYNFRPGFMQAMPGQRNLPTLYKIFAPLAPLLLKLLPNHASTLKQVAQAMIQCTTRGYPRQILEVRDIKTQATS